MKVKFIAINDKTKKPVFSTSGSAGADLFAVTEKEEGKTVLPGERVLIPTGLKLEIPQGYGGFVFPRSSLASKHGITLSNCVGVIDSDYRGELLVAVTNHSNEKFTIKTGDRIAQLVILPTPETEYEEADSFSDTKRGSGGFGSTGR